MAARRRELRRTRRLPGPKASRLIEKDRRYMSKSHTRVYPLVVDRGRGVWLWDVDGNRFLDFNAGIAVCATGHSHPAVVRAIKAQASRFLHMSGMDFYYASEINLAEKLAEIAPGKFAKRVLLCNSGTEAVEAAIKLSRYHARRSHIIAFYGAFHGRSMGSLSLTASRAVQRRNFAPLLSGVTHVPYADCLHCCYNLTFPACDFACINFIEEVVFKKTTPPEDVAAIFVEPIQGEGGYIIPPDGYHARLKKLAEKYGILFVADEVQSGMGRTGKMFAIEHWGVTPDIIAIAKGVASGLPLGAVVARSPLMDWESGAHGSTFGGNPVCSVAALETIRLIQEGLMKNAAKIVTFLIESLKDIQRRHGSIAWVRGKGLMIGMDVVKTSDNKRSDSQKRDALVQRCFENGLLILACGESSVRFSPPLVVTKSEAGLALEIFEESLTELER
ncbi:MAG: acetyl ornithine aminotransferase family protein [Candidatus Eisenbacteria bacterium]